MHDLHLAGCPRVSAGAGARIGAALAAALLACAPASEIDPRTLPYRFETTRVDGNALPADLDGDGRDELINSYRPTAHPARPELEALMIRRADGRILDQINFSARLLTPQVLDVDGDGEREILVPSVRADSLFITIADRAGRKRFAYFVTAGAPRAEPEGTISWDPAFVGAFAVDIDGDQRRELVTVISTGYARAPRGVFVHAIPDGAPLGHLLVGANIQRAHFGDFDGNGTPDVVLATATTNNGAVAGGFDDASAHLIVVSLRGSPRVTFRRNFGAGVSLYLFRSRSDEGREAFTTFAISRIPGEGSTVELLEAGTWRVLRHRPLPPHLQWVTSGNFRHTPGSEFALAGTGGELLLLDRDFNEIARSRLLTEAGLIAAVPDLDHDGLHDLFRVRPRAELLSAAGRILAAGSSDSLDGFPEGIVRVYQADPMDPPQLVVRTRQGTSLLLRPIRNRMYLAYRYGPATMATGAIALIPILALGLGRARARQHRLRAVQTAVLDGSPEGFLLLTRRGRVEWMNETLRLWAGLDRDAIRVQPARQLLTRLPALERFCRELRGTGSLHHREARAVLTLVERDRAVVLTAEPVATGRREPDWLIRVALEDEETAGGEALAWALMAQRIAHDLKNPLTSMLLTLQRMRREYRERAPDSAESLDAYSRRIEDRIQHLRRMTTNFMKFVRVDDPVRLPVSLCGFLEAQVAAMRPTLPLDIELRLRLPTDTPTVSIDEEQFVSVLENLVANAVNALPDGGAITILMTVVRSIRLSSRGR
ncbi:MAG TPA: histidine kinase dimerization/phospho-acceptor domain-containing protein, partial [Gemmatimonadaceae bacterium]|nr:histidine kinase dimerization/phospho-acceptor domain-containing protein [Gemmatimonadaceae bacterium]